MTSTEDIAFVNMAYPDIDISKELTKLMQMLHGEHDCWVFPSVLERRLVLESKMVSINGIPYSDMMRLGHIKPTHVYAGPVGDTRQRGLRLLCQEISGTLETDRNTYDITSTHPVYTYNISRSEMMLCFGPQVDIADFHRLYQPDEDGNYHRGS